MLQQSVSSLCRLNITSLIAEVEQSLLADVSDGDGFEWFDADEPQPASASQQAEQFEAWQAEQPGTEASADPSSPAANGTPSAEQPSKPAAEAAEKKKTPSPQKKRGAPMRRHTRRTASDTGDVLGFEFAPATRRKEQGARSKEPRADPATAAEALPQANGPAALLSSAAISPPPAVPAMALSGATAEPGAAMQQEQPGSSAAAAAGADDIQWEDLQPALADKQPTLSGKPPAQPAGTAAPATFDDAPAAATRSQPPAALTEVRDTDDWDVELVDLGVAEAAAAAATASRGDGLGPDLGSHAAAAAVAQAANNMRGSEAGACVSSHCLAFICSRATELPVI